MANPRVNDAAIRTAGGFNLKMQTAKVVNPTSPVEDDKNLYS